MWLTRRPNENRERPLMMPLLLLLLPSCLPTIPWWFFFSVPLKRCYPTPIYLHARITLIRERDLLGHRVRGTHTTLLCVQPFNLYPFKQCFVIYMAWYFWMGEIPLKKYKRRMKRRTKQQQQQQIHYAFLTSTYIFRFFFCCFREIDILALFIWFNWFCCWLGFCCVIFEFSCFSVGFLYQ